MYGTFGSGMGVVSASADGNAAAVSAQTVNVNSLLQRSYSTGSGGLSPVTIMIGIIGLLLGMKFLGEAEKTGIEPAHIHIGAYNLITVTVTAMIGIVLSKVLFNYVQVPGLTDFVNAV